MFVFIGGVIAADNMFAVTTYTTTYQIVPVYTVTNFYSMPVYACVAAAGIATTSSQSSIVYWSVTSQSGSITDCSKSAVVSVTRTTNQ